MTKTWLALGVYGLTALLPGAPLRLPAPRSLTLQEKIVGLLTVHAEVKYNFVFADRLGDWDRKTADMIPEIVAAPDTAAYYNLLKRLVAGLGNGHTLVQAPSDYWDSFNMPPVEVKVEGDRVFISRVGVREDLAKQGVKPGLEILTVDGEPALARFRRTILPLCSYSRIETAYAKYSMWCLAGPRNIPARIRITGGPEGPRDVELRRDTKQDDGRYFIRRQEDPIGHNLEHRRIGNILYVNLTTFGVEPDAFLPQFDKILDQAGLSATAGVILDLRDNGGGNDEAAFGVARRFLRTTAPGAKSKLRKYVGARQAWGKPEEWETIESGSIPPASGSMPRYDGPLVLLTGPETASAAEDMVMVLQSAHRASLVGARTAGDTGQIISFELPGGGFLWVCTKWDFRPDGGDLIGVGLTPDADVEPTLKDILEGRDPVLDEAIRIIRGGAGRSL